MPSLSSAGDGAVRLAPLARRALAARQVSSAALPTAAALAVAGVVLRLSGRSPAMASAPLSMLPWAVPAGAALAAGAAARGQRRSAIALAGASAVAGGVVVPRIVRSRQPDPGQDAIALTVMSINVYKGAGDPHVLLNHLRARNPDILAVQEQSPGYVRQLAAAGIEELLPHRVAASGNRLSDAAVFSRHPLEAFPVELPSVFTAATVVLPDGFRVPFISVHPLPPATPGRERHWAASLRALPSPAGELDGALAAGDFNGTLDHPQFRALLRRGWRDAAAQVGQGGRSTWVGTPFLDRLPVALLRMTIDHVLVPPGARVVACRVDRLHGSDHRLLTARVELPRREGYAARGASG